LAGMIKDQGIGVVVPPDDAGAFAGALKDLEADRSRLKEMSKKAREFAEEEFDRNKLAQKFELVLTSTIERANEG